MHTDDARFLELLEHWLQGNFTRREERELHALTEGDDFRREAWEGFVSMPENKHEAHLQALRKRLWRRPGGNRMAIGKWMAAAAAILLLLVALYFIPEWAQKNTAPVAQTTAPAAPVQTDNQPLPAEADGKSTIAAKDGTGAFAQAPIASRAAEPSAQAGKAAPKDDLTALDDSPAPEERADLELPKAKKMPPKPASKWTSGAPAQTAPPATTLPGGPTANTQLPATAQTADLSKPVGQAESKENPQPDSIRKNAEQMKARTAPQAVPPGGWDEFRRYLYRTARLTEAARNNNISGYVSLQLQIGPDGKPVNILVTQSLGYGCDEEAVRLVSATRWTPGSTEPVRVEVPFVR